MFLYRLENQMPQTMTTAIALAEGGRTPNCGSHDTPVAYVIRTTDRAIVPVFDTNPEAGKIVTVAGRTI